ncbi:phenylalanine--tRNA ligase alpha subunit, putative [Plasmodium knowlesi strain H]|uniref:phenylalanine--tRNA ligase n=3 Tax=Plasmodium knowlesi TaxID=5850 RepID=A0A5K1VH96_PLAKH|nr:phenylalanine--tRNA ligase alpha subunit, putative [Plasmodium knowlesi strain H]OTN66398.1 putative Phenylalanine--tRNA ligase alpha subunit [Plasmodium knowlesi]CAA9986306.1 phenylalanine--tRNA ligase alpha subunit, putative [Plasmodium knowlesi strain H]SBO25538.1 phenylalanine--tRNA ligase alpha subunit, putative [Plasmodium knowlesi strain H]SBO28290.1 phenylalanine--tRNA ligase alpha subunit, putative [Plasmodium knowlesi strain H]VVS75780.1 phenylalanine--tRNA ligase alpha subunit, p|eukprot:XP_002257711.1 phenylalanyl-tRNA synthetase beta chain,putative [Plasmodium knowlesi strain H]
MQAKGQEEQKGEELNHFLDILEEEFALCEEGGEKREEDGAPLGSIEAEELGKHRAYYLQLKEEKNVQVEESKYVTSLRICNKYNLEHSKVLGMAKKLETMYYVVNHVQSFNTYQLTEEGKEYLHDGSPEYVTLKYVVEQKECTLDDLKRLFGKKGDIGLNINLKRKKIELRKSDKKLCAHVEGGANSLVDDTRQYLDMVEKHGHNEGTLVSNLKQILPSGENHEEINNLIKELKKRKLMDVKKVSYIYIVRTSHFTKEIKKQITDLTYLLIKNEEYKKYGIKKYNFFSSGKKMNKGNIHLLIRQMRIFKDIFVSLGFEEMDTHNYVESSFWCFDALYIPQQHPSRDLQDTFFIEKPELCMDNFTDKCYIDNVKRVHSVGDYGSFGWNYQWELKSTKKNVLRTHTTANSCRALFQLAKEYEKTGSIIPKKYFSIDRVFRNENLDSTHLAEFHQVEGLIIDKNLGLSHLIGTLTAFYKHIGICKLRFKPTFNPYTEPSMEVYGYHEENKKWMEVGNSGIFRPEMLRAMGFPPEVSVIAWGLSLERPTMIKYNIRNIRDLFGYRSVL